MTRIPYKSYPDDDAAFKVMRMIAALPMWIIVLAAIVIGSALGWAAVAA